MDILHCVKQFDAHSALHILIHLAQTGAHENTGLVLSDQSAAIFRPQQVLAIFSHKRTCWTKIKSHMVRGKCF